MSFTGVVFTKNANAVTLESVPESGYEQSIDKTQAYGRTADGTVYVYTKGVNTHWWMLSFRGLSSTEKTNLETLFYNSPTDSPAGVNGMENTFTYTDETGTNWTARFLTSTLSFDKVVAEAYNVSFELELEET
jgi:hypothetical protein